MNELVEGCAIWFGFLELLVAVIFAFRRDYLP